MLEWLAENYKLVIVLCSAIIELGFIIVGYLANSKNKKVAKTSQGILNILGYAEEAVKLAEKYTHFGKDEKKAYAVMLVKNMCMENNVNFTEEQISNAIENVITISKKVNARPKDLVKDEE